MKAKLLTFGLLILIACSVAQASLFGTWIEESKEINDAVFPELISNTEQCLTDCSATFKYCLDGTNDIEMSFDKSSKELGITYGYYTTESETHKENTDKCLKEEDRTYKCSEEELKNESGCKDYTYKECIEYEQKDVTTESKTWHNGLPKAEKGCYEITINGHKKPFENVDWIPTLKVKGFLWDTEYTQEKWAWWNGSWLYNSEINISSIVSTDELVSVNLTIDTKALIDAGKMQSDCDDLRFINDSNTGQLKYEYENKDSTVFGCNTNNTIIFIRETIKSDNSTSIYMYYGNPSATSTSNNNDVFLNGVRISHMSTNKDSSPYNATMTTYGTVPTATGIIGNAYKFNGTETHRLAYSDSAELDITGSQTHSAWVNYTTAGGSIISRWGDSKGKSYLIWNSPISVQLSNGGDKICSGATAVPTNQWYLVTSVFNSTNQSISLYINGVLNKTCGIAVTSTASSTQDYDIGASLDSGANGLSGTLDEVNSYNYTYSTNAIKLEYSLQTLNLVTFGAETEGNSISFLTQAPANNSVINNTLQINFSFTPSSTQSAILNCTIKLNDSQIYWNDTVYNNTLTTYNYTTGAYSYYNWTLNCSNSTVPATNQTIYFVTLNNTESITIDTFQPANNSVINDTLYLDINFTPHSQAISPMNCSWWLNGTLNGYNETSYNNTNTSISLTGLSFSYYSVTLNCNNSLASKNETYFFTINNTNFINFITQAPANNSVINDTLQINFSFTPYAKTTPIINCTIKLNGSQIYWNDTVYNNTLTTYNYTTMAYGFYNWTLNCSNSSYPASNQTVYFVTLNDTLAPVTTATAIGNTSGLPYTFGTTSSEGIIITLNCSDAGIGCNTTLYCIDEVDTCVPNITYAGA